MSNHNYSQYSNKKNNNNKKHNNPKPVQVAHKDDVIPEATSTIDLDVAQPNVNLVQETVGTVTLPEVVEGSVINCAKLNVRAEPNINAEIVCVLDVMSEIEIDVSKSTSEWLKICTATGIDGYCMRKFVDARL